jgi:gliding motility-associated-like protein
MNRIIYFLLLLVLLTSKGYGQALVITDSATTTSVCFNDGTIHVNATGGNGPYTFSVIAGPSYANVTYPITLTAGSTVFLTMPKGEYTIKVVDASGNVAYATATVGGSYQFPVLTAIVDQNNCIVATVQGGRPQYSYAISSIGTNTGFGAYQSSNVFCVCSGHYWVRVKDSCSNIFTTVRIDVSVTPPSLPVGLLLTSSAIKDTIRTPFNGTASPYTFHLKSGSLSITNSTGVFVIPKSCRIDTVLLIDRCNDTVSAIINPHTLIVAGNLNCCGDSSSAVIKIDSNSLGPFTITAVNGTIHTHDFLDTIRSLPTAANDTFHVSDSCGNSYTLIMHCDKIKDFFVDVCPFDSALHLNPTSRLCFPATVTCLNCSPVLTQIVYSVQTPLFYNIIDTGFIYRLSIRDACCVRDTVNYATHFNELLISDSILACNSFQLSSTPRHFSPLIHYSLYNAGSFIDSATADDPAFFHVPIGNYQIVATYPLCKKTIINLSLPALGGKCAVPMFDSACTPSYAIFQQYPPTSEVWSLVNTTTHISYTEHLPHDASGALLFAYVPVGNYNLVSDSGCSVPYQLAPFNHTVSATFLSQCTGQAQIAAVATPPVTSCNSSQGQYFQLVKNNQFVQGNDSGKFVVTDTGYYVVRLFLSNTSIFYFPANYDTICPLDTFLLHVTVPPLPAVVSVTQEVCGHHTANIPYKIISGLPPFTVQILGYPTRTVNTHSDTFPNVYPGIYTMVVNDDCGISNSFSVAVIDTCSSTCSTQSHFSLSDSVVCRGSRIHTHNQSVAASHYKWVLNNNLYGYSMDTSYAATVAGRYTVKLYAYIGTCKDSSTHTFVVEDSLRRSAMADTFVCMPLSIKLNSHYAHTQWSNTVVDSVVTVTTPGLYWAQVSNICGSYRDSLTVTGRQSPVFTIMSSKNALCEDEADTAILSAVLTDTNSPPVIFRWNTGSYDSAAISSHTIVYHDGSYHLVVTNGMCPVSKDISVGKTSCDSTCLSDLATPNIFTPNGDNRNDTFFIPHLCQFDPYLMHIYNRWGQLVFESTDIEKGWDGLYNGEPQPSGVYWYWVSLSIQGKKPAYRSGTLTLMR